MKRLINFISFVLIVSFLIILISCTRKKETQNKLKVNEIIDSRLNHGIGEDPFDSDIFKDTTLYHVLIQTRHPSTIKDINNYLKIDDFKIKSAVDTLENNRFIKVINNKYQSAFPIIIKEDEVKYRQETRDIALRILPRIKDQIKDIIYLVDTNGWQEWRYHIVWSQLFDSPFIWKEMMEKRLVPLLTHNMWWIIYPRHPYFTGTNYYGSDINDQYFLMVSWTPFGSNTLGWIGGQAEYIFQKKFTGKPLEESVINSLSKINHLNIDHSLTIPVISSQDSIYHKLNEVAKIYCNLLEQEFAMDKLNRFIHADDQYIWAMAYHDISWEILNILDNEGVIKRPNTLTDPDDLNMTGVSAMTEIYKPWLEILGF